MPEPLLRIMYTSRAHRSMTKDELSELLADARIRNEKFSITGLLLYNAGHFAQVLEGPVAAVRHLLEKIGKDPRHTDYSLISEGYIDERYFNGWAMDWVNLESMDDVKHIRLRRILHHSYIGDRSTVFAAVAAFADEHRKSR